jgi:cystathionine gamma-synthase
MRPKIETATGYPIPPAPRHSVTVHWPGWDNWAKVRDRHMYPTLMSEFHSIYPRVKVHADITEVRPVS